MFMYEAAVVMHSFFYSRTHGCHTEIAGTKYETKKIIILTKECKTINILDLSSITDSFRFHF